MNESPALNRRKYGATFKREAVLNWLSSGKGATTVAELGITTSRLYAWRALVPAARRGSLVKCRCIIG